MTNLIKEAEEAAAHLAVLGYYPVKAKTTWGKSHERGVRNQTQFAKVKWDKVFFDPVADHVTYTDIEWWELTDAAILLLARSIDNTLIGW